MTIFNITEIIDTDFNFNNIIVYSVKTQSGKIHKEPCRMNHGFVYILNGLYDYQTFEDEIISLPEDSIIYLPKNSQYSHIAQRDSQAIVVNFDLDEISFSSDISKLEFAKSKTLQRDFVNLYNEYYISGNPAKLKIALYNIVLTIYGEYKKTKKDKRYTMIQPAIEYLETNNIFDTNVSELADMCYLSQNAFRNIFKEYHDMLPNQFLIKRRLERACQLLKNTNLSIMEIAEQLNFKDPAHFSNSFKKFMNVTPNKYR